MRSMDETVEPTTLRSLTLLAVLIALLTSQTLAQPQPPKLQLRTPPPPEDAPNAAFPQLVPSDIASSTKWAIPPGLSLDARLRVQKVITIQNEIDRTPPEKLDWLQTLPELHAILADESDTLISPLGALRPGGGFGGGFSDRPRISLKQAVTKLIVELPETGRQNWRQLYADTAAAQLRAAVDRGDQRAMAVVASSFVETPAGWQAAELLGVRSLDSERPDAAIRYLDRLRQSPEARRAREPQLSLTIAAAWTLLGRDDQAGLVIAQLRSWLAEKSPANAAPNPAASNPDAQQGRASNSAATRAAIQKLLDTPTSELVAEVRASVPHDLLDSGVTDEWRQPFGAVTNSASVLPVAPAGQVLWRSFTDGFAGRPTLADRTPFATPWADYDEEPYPQTPAQMAGMIELAIDYLRRLDIEESQVGLPVGQPLIVGRLAVLRTLDRVRAVDVETGEVVWESFQQDPAFAEQFDLRTAKQALNFPRTEIRSPVNQAQEALLIARTRLDRTTGTLSSDGQRVYFVDGGGIASRATRFGMARLVEIIPKDSNTLRAIDLATGRLAWELGGAPDTPRLPGAGRFFLGPPTCLDDGLYVLAEDDGYVLLLRLDPQTGEMTWQQELGQAISPVINEALRRNTGEAPVVAGGLLVCTMSSGQVFAVDPAEQRIVWASSYPSDIPPARRLPSTLRMTVQPMNTDLQDDLNRWRETLAVASAGRLILSAVDSSVLACLDVVTGESLWKQPRKDGLFVAATYDDRVILVGEYGVRSLDLRSGETQWNVAFESRVPAGRGVRSGDIYHLPIAIVIPPPSPQRHGQTAESGKSADTTDPDNAAPLTFPEDAADDSLLPPIAQLEGAILSLDLRTGRVLAESPAPSGIHFGNLAAADGRLVTQNFDSVIALESISAEQSRLAKQLAEQPDAPEALLSRARLRLHNGDRAGVNDLLQALTLLAKTNPREATSADEAAIPAAATLRRQAESLLIGQVLEIQKQGETLDGRLFELLDQINLDAGSRLTMQRVKTDSLVQQLQFGAAFQQLIQMAETARAAGSDGSSGPTLTDEGVTLPLHRWVASQLAAVYRAAALSGDASTQIAAIEQVISDELEQAQKTTSAERAAQLNDWLNLFAWHVSATDVRLQLAAEQSADKLQFVEQLLAPLIDSTSPQTEARGRAALVDAYVRSGRGSAATSELRSLKRLTVHSRLAADTALLKGESLAELTARWSASETVRTARSAIAWPDRAPAETLQENEPATPLPRHYVERLCGESALLDGWILELNSAGLTGFDADGRAQWTVPADEIPGFPDVSRQRFRAVWLAAGSLFAIVINSDMAVFDASSTPPRRLWSQSLISNDPALLPFGQKSFEFGMQVSTYRLRTGSRALGAVDLLTPNVFVWRSSNRLHVVDSRTGDLLWERPAPSGEGFVFGDDRLLVLAETAPAQSRVFETSTGRLLATFDLPERTFLVSVAGAIPVFMGLQDEQIEFRSLDVMTGESRWTIPYDRSSVALPFDGHLVILKPQGQLQVHDLDTGGIVADLKITPLETQIGELQCHATPDGFVLLTWAPTAQFRFGLNRLSTTAREQSPVNGYACGVDLQTPGIVWEGQVEASFILKPQPRNLPVVLLASSHTRTDDGVNLKKPRYELTAIDTRTGKPAARFTTDEPFTNVDARRLAVDGQPDPQVEINVTGSVQPVTLTLDYSK